MKGQVVEVGQNSKDDSVPLRTGCYKKVTLAFSIFLLPYLSFMSPFCMWLFSFLLLHHVASKGVLTRHRHHDVWIFQ